MDLTLFWFSFFTLAYIYFLYPMIIAFLSLFINSQVRKKHTEPVVSIIISAYNEERHIKSTLENKLKLDYPKDKMEIIVVSDGSTDGTDEVVRRFGRYNVRLLRQEPRQGKTSALNMAVLQAKGEILIFSDANSIYSKNAIKELVSNFSDSSVGYVTGKMVYMNEDGSIIGDGCSVYMKYENILRKIETSVGSIVGVDGGIDAIRKELYVTMRADQLPDFVLPLRVIEQRYRVVYDPAAVLYENALSRLNDEYRMRVRVSLRTLNAIKDMKHLLNPFAHGLFGWQFLSHKVLRYAVFIFLIVMYLSNLFIASANTFYASSFILQSAFYVAAIIGLYLEKRVVNFKVFYIPSYFCLINFAAAHAFWRFLNKEKQVIWVPRKG